MDPLTHALTGAAIAYVANGRALGRRALLVGATAALLPDVDILIRSASDPLLAIEHHRGLTHSFALVPAGGAIAALTAGRGRWRASLFAAMLAYLSHILLDAAATFGTQLFWPFSRQRVGLDAISIIDPPFTLIALIAVIFAFRARRLFAAGAVALMIVWLAIGLAQRERASAAQFQLAALRGHQLVRGEVFPTVGNTIVWRSIYESDGILYTDRLRLPWFGTAAFVEGPSMPVAATPPGDGMTAADFARFAWFADRWVARDPNDRSIIGDARYSMVTGQYVPVWGIRFDAKGNVAWVDRSRQRRISPRALWNEIIGRDAAFRPLGSAPL